MVFLALCTFAQCKLKICKTPFWRNCIFLGIEITIFILPLLFGILLLCECLCEGMFQCQGIAGRREGQQGEYMFLNRKNKLEN